jgi:hypothetical protein
MIKTKTLLLCLVCCCVTATYLLSSCSDGADDVFGESAANRMAKSQSEYTTILESQQQGWAVDFYPSDRSQGGVAYTARFHDGEVAMTCEQPITNSVTSTTGSQCLVSTNATASAGSQVQLSNGSTALASFTVPTGYSPSSGGGRGPGGGPGGGGSSGFSILVSCPGMTTGSNYSLTVGSTVKSCKASTSFSGM